MPGLVARIGAVLSEYDATAVVRELSDHPTCPVGRWRVSTNRWELWSAEAGDRPLASIELTYDVPRPSAATITRVAISSAGLNAELTPELACDLALQTAGFRLADCPRGHAAEQAPVPAVAGTEQMASVAEDEVLDSTEDRELRRLHYLATFGGLTGALAERYAELRSRDRRTGVREPTDDELVVLPRQIDDGSDMDAAVTAL